MSTRRRTCYGNGLYLQVQPTKRQGGASWLLRYSLGGRKRWMGLGSYPLISLAEALDKAQSGRVLLQQGDDPIDERRAVRR